MARQHIIEATGAVVVNVHIDQPGAPYSFDVNLDRQNIVVTLADGSQYRVVLNPDAETPVGFEFLHDDVPAGYDQPRGYCGTCGMSHLLLRGFDPVDEALSVADLAGDPTSKPS